MSHHVCTRADCGMRFKKATEVKADDQSHCAPCPRKRSAPSLWDWRGNEAGPRTGHPTGAVHGLAGNACQIRLVPNSPSRALSSLVLQSCGAVLGFDVRDGSLQVPCRLYVSFRGRNDPRTSGSVSTFETNICYSFDAAPRALVHRRSSALTNFGWSVLYIRLQS